MITVLNWIIPLCIGYFVSRLWSYVREKRPLLALWRPFLVGQTIVVFSEIPYPDEDLKQVMEVGGLIASKNESIALGELSQFLSSIGSSDIKFHSSGSKLDLTQTNLILLGGPINNPVSKKVFEKINSPLQFLDHKIIDSEEQITFSPTEGKNDFGLVIIGENPYSQSRQMMILAGSYATGTQAAVRAIITPSLIIKIVKNYVKKNRKSVFVVKTEIVEGQIQMPTIYTSPRHF